MFVIEAPDIFEEKNYPALPHLFLAGGITGAPDWQKTMVALLSDLNIVMFNPRRGVFELNSPDVERKQIEWEFTHFRKADAISFWFPKETIAPITLYELGAWAMTSVPIFVGVEPGYARSLDIDEQLKLARPEVEIVTSLEELAGQIRMWSETRTRQKTAE